HRHRRPVILLQFADGALQPPGLLAADHKLDDQRREPVGVRVEGVFHRLATGEPAGNVLGDRPHGERPRLRQVAEDSHQVEPGADAVLELPAPPDEGRQRTLGGGEDHGSVPGFVVRVVSLTPAGPEDAGFLLETRNSKLETTRMEDRPAEYDDRYLAGVQLFNAGEYFDAHEVWEDLWHDCPSADRRFYQSLIQAAVALYHWSRGNRPGAARLFDSGR